MRREKPLLVGWNRSAYTRRVAISMHVYGIEFDQRAQTAWDHFDDVKEFNPIVKIPALVSENGEVIVESAAILDYLDCRVGPERALMPPPSALRDRVRQIVALATAIIDKGRELRYEVHLRPAELRFDDQIHALFDDAAALGRLDVAVFNAGAQHRQPFLEIDPAMFEKVWRLGCRAGFVVGQAAAKQMVEHGKGTIIFTGATSATRGGAEFTAFAAAKAGLRSIAQSMARSLGPRGIHVCHVIVDGMIDMPAIHERFPDLVAGLPEGGMLDTDAIAETYYALHCQDRSAWTLEIDVRPWCEKF